MKAIVIGATGATGKELVRALLSNPAYSHVIALVRRPHFSEHPKLVEQIVDFDDLAHYEPDVVPDVAFSCLGTTLKIAGSKDAQWKIDVDYSLAFARRMKQLGTQRFVLLSSMGANAASSFFYARMKGTLEEEIEALGFEHFVVLRPGSLIRPNSDRTGEKTAVRLLQWLNGMGLLRTYRPLPVRTVARAMAESANTNAQKKQVLDVNDIAHAAKENPPI